MSMPPLNASYSFLSPLPTNCEGSVPCFQIPRLGSVCKSLCCDIACYHCDHMIHCQLE